MKPEIFTYLYYQDKIISAFDLMLPLNVGDHYSPAIDKEYVVKNRTWYAELKKSLVLKITLVDVIDYYSNI